MSEMRDSAEADIGWSDGWADSAGSQDGRVLMWSMAAMTKALLAIDDTLREIRDRLPEVPQ